MVSTMPIFQLAIRLSTISKHGAIAAVAAITSAGVTPGPLRLSLRMKAISASARGWIRPLALMSTVSPTAIQSVRKPKSG